MQVQCCSVTQLLGPTPYICGEAALFLIALDRPRTLAAIFHLPWIGRCCPSSCHTVHLRSVIMLLAQNATPFMLGWWRTNLQEAQNQIMKACSTLDFNT